VTCQSTPQGSDSKRREGGFSARANTPTKQVDPKGGLPARRRVETGPPFTRTTSERVKAANLAAFGGGGFKEVHKMAPYGALSRAETRRKPTRQRRAGHGRLAGNLQGTAERQRGKAIIAAGTRRGVWGRPRPTSTSSSEKMSLPGGGAGRVPSMKEA